MTLAKCEICGKNLSYQVEDKKFKEKSLCRTCLHEELMRGKMTETLQDKIDAMFKELSPNTGNTLIEKYRVEEAIQELREELIKLDKYYEQGDTGVYERRGVIYRVLVLIGEKK